MLHLREGNWVVIDEAQRVLELLNEIHSLYERQGIQFAITGSSARKLKRSHANLLAGRAIRCDFFPFVLAKIVNVANISECIEFGTLPPVVADWSLPLLAVTADPKTRMASSYGVYLGEKIIEDGALTILPFAEFSRRLWSGEIF